MAKVGNEFKTCPYCEFEYEHRTTLPDICLSCGQVLNKEPVGKTFAVPDYLMFQIMDKQDEIKQNAQPITSNDESAAISRDDVIIKLADHLETELSLFMRTCSFEVVSKAVLESLEFCKQAQHSTTLNRKDLKALAQIAKDIGEVGKLLEIQSEKGAVLYEYRAKTVNTAELGVGSRGPIDTEKA